MKVIVHIKNSTKWLYALIVCEEKDHCLEKKGIFDKFKGFNIQDNMPNYNNAAV